MSYDLFFCREDGSTPSIEQLKGYFSALPCFEIRNIQPNGAQFWYENDATGVYCDFSFSPSDDDELKGCAASGLTFNLNLCRPGFFAYETMPLVEAFCHYFDLIVVDPNDQSLEAKAEPLIASWRAHNKAAIKALGAMTDEDKPELHYLPESRATEWWRYMHVKQSIEAILTEDIFVPSVMILLNPEKKLLTMMVWPNAISQFFPPCDYVFVEREKKRLFGRTKEAGLVSYEVVMQEIGRYLDDYDVAGMRLKYLRPEKTINVLPILRSLTLQSIDLSRYTAPANLHDVGAE